MGQGMARDESNPALACDDFEVFVLAEPRGIRSTLLPPALPADELNLVGLGGDPLSLAALEAAIDALPFDDENGEPGSARNDNATEGDAVEDGLSVNDRPTRRYTVPDLPPFMRPTVQPEVQPET
jgi:hypothetical protein